MRYNSYMRRWLMVLDLKALIALGLALAFAACSRASESSEAKKLQSPAPPRDVEVPPALAIAVEVDGAAEPPILAATLSATPADFSDEDRKVWLISTLVPGAAAQGAVVEAAAASGISVKIANPAPDGMVPVLFLTRRGDVIASTIDPVHPFPKYHGQGGRLHRAGDSQPRVAAVAKLTITHVK